MEETLETTGEITEESTDATESTAEETTQIELSEKELAINAWVEQNRVIPDVIPEFVQGTMKVYSAEEAQRVYPFDFTAPPKYRYIYYKEPWFLYNLVDQDEWFEWYAYAALENWESNTEPEEMYTVSFVKYFNISKEDFQKCINELKLQYEEANTVNGDDISDEEHEIYNADIIYTFDNEIINNYYLRDQSLGESVTEQIEPVQTKPPTDSIGGLYYCSTDFFTDEYRIETPGNTPFIIFNDDGSCVFSVFYLHGKCLVEGTYQIEGNVINVDLDLQSSYMGGTDTTGTPYMDDKFVFEIIDNDHIVIGAASDSVYNGDCYAVKAGDSFIRK